MVFEAAGDFFLFAFRFCLSMSSSDIPIPASAFILANLLLLLVFRSQVHECTPRCCVRVACVRSTFGCRRCQWWWVRSLSAASLGLLRGALPFLVSRSAQLTASLGFARVPNSQEFPSRTSLTKCRPFFFGSLNSEADSPREAGGRVGNRASTPAHRQSSRSSLDPARRGSGTLRTISLNTHTNNSPTLCS